MKLKEIEQKSFFDFSLIFFPSLEILNTYKELDI